MKIIKVLLLLSLAVLLSGCNTARGVGADLEVLGRKMQGLDNNAVLVEGVPPRSNVVEVPTTYQSGQTYENYANDVRTDYQSPDDAQAYTTPYAGSSTVNKPIDDSSTYQSPFEASKTYQSPFENDTTYSNLPDAITYPVE